MNLITIIIILIILLIILFSITWKFFGNPLSGKEVLQYLKDNDLENQTTSSKLSSINSLNNLNAELFKVPLSEMNLVLDIDNCLVATTSEHFIENTDIKSIGNSLSSRLYRIKLNNTGSNPFDGMVNINYVKNLDFYEGIKRPHLDTFLDFALKNFKGVYIWSAGKKEYVIPMTEEIFKNHNRKPDGIFTYDHLSILDNGQYSKPLKNIGLELDNTIMIDDRGSNFVENPNNGIVISKYEPNFTNLNELKKNDTALLEITEQIKQKFNK